jgi:hypothetical protein
MLRQTKPFFCAFVVALSILSIGCGGTNSKSNSTESGISVLASSQPDDDHVRSNAKSGVSDTTIDGFFKKAKGCPTKYYPGGLGEGELNVFCPDEQFLLVFSFKEDSAADAYVDDYIFKKGLRKERVLTDDHSVYDQFDCFALVDQHDRGDKKFPFPVTGYKRISGDNWKLERTALISSQDEFERFRASMYEAK